MVRIQHTAAPLIQAPTPAPRPLGALSLPSLDFSSWQTWAMIAGAGLLLWFAIGRGRESSRKRRRRIQLARLEYEKQRLS